MSFTPMAYEPSGLVKAVHSLPHLDLSLGTVDKLFRPTNSDYIQFLGLCTLPAVVTIMAVLVAFTIFHMCRRRGQCLGRTYYEPKGRDRSEMPPWWPRALFFAAVFVLILASVGAVWGTKMTADGLSKSISSVDSINTDLVTLKSYGSQLQTYCSSAAVASAAIGQAAAGSADVVSAAATVTSSMSTVSNNTKIFDGLLNSGPGEMDNARGYLATYSGAPMYCVAGVTMVLLLVAVTAVFLKSVLLLHIFSLVSLAFFVVSACFLGVQMAAMAGSADLCYDPIEFATHEAPPEFKSVTKYYGGRCEGTNPLAKEMNYQPGEDVTLAVETLRTYVDGHPELMDQMNTVQRGTSLSDNYLPLINITISCSHLQPVVLNLENQLCGTTLGGYFLFLVSTAVGTLVLAFLAFAAFVVTDHLPRARGPGQDDHPDLETPLISDGDKDATGTATGGGGGYPAATNAVSFATNQDRITTYAPPAMGRGGAAVPRAMSPVKFTPRAPLSATPIVATKVGSDGKRTPSLPRDGLAWRPQYDSDDARSPAGTPAESMNRSHEVDSSPA